MQKTEEKQFKKTVLTFYKKEGRHTLPWRQTTDPYKIIVSELMLQQTQVSRVIEKYGLFLKAFPTVKKLANAPLGDVLRVWSGLGYNRRAKYLHMMARVVVSEYKGVFPKTKEELLRLPGIGSYTAGAVMAFAYNIPIELIETNIRTVYIHHFFATKRAVSDRDLLPFIKQTLDQKNPRRWYAALMDYGSFLKVRGNKSHRVSAQYVKQTSFKGSRRSVRGYILKTLISGSCTLRFLTQNNPAVSHDIEEVLADLIQEGLVVKTKSRYSVP